MADRAKGRRFSSGRKRLSSGPRRFVGVSGDRIGAAMDLSLVYLLDMLGTTVFAISGALAASRANMDVFGFSVLALMPAVGGGTLRDIILGRFPVFWVHDNNYVIIAIVAAIAVFLLANRPGFRRNLLIWMDAAGLALFAVLGTRIAIDLEASPIIAVMMGVVTAVTGGMIRDIICNEVPLVLSKEIYATAAFAASIVYLLTLRVGVGEDAALVFGIIVGFVVRGVGIRFHISLPSFTR